MSDRILSILIFLLETDLVPLALAVVTLEEALVERDAVLAEHESRRLKDPH